MVGRRLVGRRSPPIAIGVVRVGRVGVVVRMLAAMLMRLSPLNALLTAMAELATAQRQMQKHGESGALRDGKGHV